jgi:hypothetical protein
MAQSGTIVSPRDAVLKAHEALSEMIPDAEQPRLEEIVLSDDNRWLVTLSFASPSLPEEYDALAAILSASVKRPHRRQVRVFEIDATSGYFKGMKARRDG